MATLAIFTFVLEAAKAAGDAAGWRSKLNGEKRKQFADLCDKISGLLKEFGEASENRRLEMNLCAQLEQYAKRIGKLAAGRVSSEEIDSLVRELKSVCKTWRRIAGDAQSSGHAAELDLDEIARAEGAFRGLADVMRSM